MIKFIKKVFDIIMVPFALLMALICNVLCWTIQPPKH